VDLDFDDDLDGFKDRAARRAGFNQWAKGVTEDSMPTAQLDTRDVTAQQVNGNGFKTTDGDWLNLSKFAKPADVSMPHVGDRVVVSLDRSGFVRKVEPAAAPAKPAEPVQAAPAPATPPPSAPSIVQDDRGVVVTRLSNLNTATAILSSGGRVANPDEVLALAARLEVWATR
jgi:hypothetical protein